MITAASAFAAVILFTAALSTSCQKPFTSYALARPQQFRPAAATPSHALFSNFHTGHLSVSSLVNVQPPQSSLEVSSAVSKADQSATTQTTASGLTSTVSTLCLAVGWLAFLGWCWMGRQRPGSVCALSWGIATTVAEEEEQGWCLQGALGAP